MDRDHPDESSRHQVLDGPPSKGAIDLQVDGGNIQLCSVSEDITKQWHLKVYIELDSLQTAQDML